MIESLDVMIWGKKVGTLVSTPKGYANQICFYYDADFVKGGLDIAPLSASIHGVAAQNGMPIYPESGKEFGGLPSFIADSLPDHWGNVVFNEWVKAHNIRKKDLSPLDRLAYIGRRGMGALEFVPPISANLETLFQVEIAELSRLAQLALKEATNFHTVMSPDFMVESLFKVGTSAGGRRPKAVININLVTNECYSGQVATPLPGFIPMIIKFDEHSDVPTTRIEYSYFLMAMAAGLNMMPSRMIGGEKETHFITERFDRRATEKIHVQTLAALSPVANSYEELFDTAFRLKVSSVEMNQLFLHMVMNVLSGNVDDHSKNFSFIMEKNGKWHTSPAYDFTFAVDPSAPFYVNRHSMTINGKSQDISKEDLMSIAGQFNIRGASAIIGKASATVRNYRNFAEQAGVPEKWIERIESEISDRLQNLESVS